jgi:hypothetical protein
MFFSDLHRYRYLAPIELGDVVTVGWLSREHPFPVGSVDKDLVQALERLLETNRVNQTRGIHLCDFCATSQSLALKLTEREIMLGSAELWVPSSDRKLVYAAPDLVYHYITAHQYAPPDEFNEAILYAHQHGEWDAVEECEKRLTAAFQ